tara:strand:+ start:1192 stop:2655 length:1464 start_codon:yes stop_codon:yes gene_type:complete
MKINTQQKTYIFITLTILIVITLLTNFYGEADIYDYQDVSKYFSGKYSAKIRTSHSYLYGLIHTPFVSMLENYFIFKVTSLISLLLIVYSIYWISGKNKKALWLILLSPIIWYMSPWVSPIQLASLIFLWGYYFITKYERSNKVKHLFFSAALIGLSWAFWDGILFIIPLFIASFLYDKKLIHSIYFISFLILGVLPRLILDHFLFGFALFGIARHVLASLALAANQGIYNQESLSGILRFILVLLFIPFYTYLIFKKKNFLKNKKTAIFIILVTILLIINSQVRFTLLITPIIILSLYKILDKKGLLLQISFSLILAVLVINPYVIQTSYDLQNEEPSSGKDFASIILSINNLKISKNFRNEILSEDLSKIIEKNPNQVFVVGNKPDNYQVLADIYWGSEVKEFVSIQDYNLFLENNQTIAEKEFCSSTKIKNRRDLCGSLTIRNSFNDETDYKSIQYGISLDNSLDIENFELIGEYELLRLYKKV